jgi:hypothetical protein
MSITVCYSAALLYGQSMTALPGDPKAVEHQLRIQISSACLRFSDHFAPEQAFLPFTLIQFCSALLLHKRLIN